MHKVQTVQARVSAARGIGPCRVTRSHIQSDHEAIFFFASGARPYGATASEPCEWGLPKLICTPEENCLRDAWQAPSVSRSRSPSRQRGHVEGEVGSTSNLNGVYMQDSSPCEQEISLRTSAQTYRIELQSTGHGRRAAYTTLIKGPADFKLIVRRDTSMGASTARGAHVAYTMRETPSVPTADGRRPTADVHMAPHTRPCARTSLRPINPAEDGRGAPTPPSHLSSLCAPRSRLSPLASHLSHWHAAAAMFAVRLPGTSDGCRRLPVLVLTRFADVRACRLHTGLDGTCLPPSYSLQC